MATQKAAQTKAAPGKGVAKQEQKANLAIQVGGDMPAFLQQTQGDKRGRENVGADDLVIPRLELCQALSPCLNKNKAEFIEGIEQGDLYNNVTREVYGKDVIVIPVGYVKEYLLWKDRDKGGGFGGAFPNEDMAEEARKELEGAADYQVVDTGQQFCLLVKMDGSGVEEIVVSMAKSKAKVSRKWNSLIRMTNGPSFGRAYRLTSVEEQNTKKQDYWNFSVAVAGYPPEELYRVAEKMYEQIAKGKVSANRDMDGEDVIDVAESAESKASKRGI